MFSVCPPNTVPLLDEAGTSSATTIPQSVIPAPVVQIVSAINLLPVQTLPFPFPLPESLPNLAVTSNSTIRLLTTIQSAKSSLFLISTPVDRALATAEGSCVWRFEMKSWGEQIDELVQNGRYSDALALLDTLDQLSLSDKVNEFMYLLLPSY